MDPISKLLVFSNFLGKMDMLSHCKNSLQFRHETENNISRNDETVSSIIIRFMSFVHWTKKKNVYLIHLFKYSVSLWFWCTRSMSEHHPYFITILTWQTNTLFLNWKFLYFGSLTLPSKCDFTMLRLAAKYDCIDEECIAANLNIFGLCFANCLGSLGSLKILKFNFWFKKYQLVTQSLHSTSQCAYLDFKIVFEKFLMEKLRIEQKYEIFSEKIW